MILGTLKIYRLILRELRLLLILVGIRKIRARERSVGRATILNKIGNVGIVRRWNGWRDGGGGSSRRRKVLGGRFQRRYWTV